MTTPLQELTDAATTANRAGHACMTLARLCETVPPVDYQHDNGQTMCAWLYKRDITVGNVTYSISVNAFVTLDGEQDGVVTEMLFDRLDGDPFSLRDAEEFGGSYAEALDVLTRADRELARITAAA